MTHILLISPDNTLFHPFRTALPTNVELVQLPTVAETQNYLTFAQSNEIAIDLIILHTEDIRRLAKALSDLRNETSIAHIPLIVLLANPEDRQQALQLGANDYLLLPLISDEINARVQAHLRSPLQTFQSIALVIDHLKQGLMSTDTWEQGLVNLSKVFKATSAWVFLVDKVNEKTILAGGYNLPPLLTQNEANLYGEIDAFFQMLTQTEDKAFNKIVGPYEVWPGRTDTNGLTHHILIPLHNDKQLLGVLTLAYNDLPNLSKFEKQTLTILGQSLGVLLEMQRIQEETQGYATQNAFMVLIARTISERLDLSAILALTLEQVVPLLNASGGDIWLLSKDNMHLDLTSSLSSPLAHHKHVRRLKDQGLIGWVAQKNKSLYTTAPFDDPRCDPNVDQLRDIANYSLVAVPLSHRGYVIGVLAVYNKQGTPFANRDAILLEGIASLTASAIANARMLQEIQANSDQRRILYEMSQQIAAGLDLQATLNRTLHWVGRLFNVEFGLLWLVDRNQEALHLAAALGIDVSANAEKVTVKMGQGLVGWVAQSGETILTNSPQNHPRIDQATFDMFTGTLRNVLIAPMTYYGQSIGALSLINKMDGGFDEADLTLLSTALEIIAVAVGNARLYTQTITLMEERERLHQQILQSERLATLGRLTATLSHEINNPMQAIQGALTLSLEELDNPAELSNYINLSLDESKRVVKLLNRMRQVYRPQTDITETLNINHLLQETITLARKELKRQNIKLHLDLASDLPRLSVVANQMHLVFLSLLLNLSDAISAADGHELRLRSYTVNHVIRVEFSAPVSAIPMADWLDAFNSGIGGSEMNLGFGLSLSQDIVVAHGGAIEMRRFKEQIICRVELPVAELAVDKI